MESIVLGTAWWRNLGTMNRLKGPVPPSCTIFQTRVHRMSHDVYMKVRHPYTV